MPRSRISSRLSSVTTTLAAGGEARDQAPRVSFVDHLRLATAESRLAPRGSKMVGMLTPVRATIAWSQSDEAHPAPKSQFLCRPWSLYRRPIMPISTDSLRVTRRKS